MSEIKASAELVTPCELAFEQSRKRTTRIDQARGVKYTQAKGVRDARERTISSR